MKRIVASIGLVALGASSIQLASAQSADTSKPWSVSAALRGFYDDNLNTTPKDGNGFRQRTLGYEVTPSVGLNWNPEQTTLSARYEFGYKQYDHSVAGRTDKNDQTHTFGLVVTHAFSERYKIAGHENFVIGQESEMLTPNAALPSLTRHSGDNVHNDGGFVFNAELTPKAGLELAYNNTVVHYQDESEQNDGAGNYSSSVGGVLNRIENSPRLEAQYFVQPETTLGLGYQFTDTSYNSGKIVGGVLGSTTTPLVYSDERDNASHVVYLGATHNFTPDLSGLVRVGVEAVDYYNSKVDKTDTSPYIMLNLKYVYAPESSAQIGFTYNQIASDFVQFTSADNGFTRGEQAAMVYAQVDHKILSKLYGNLTGRFQDATMNGGAADGKAEQLYMLGASLEYRFTQNFSTSLGYSYDDQVSDLNRSFDRNRVWIGLAASY